METGYLVEFFEQKRILCAVVLELKGERLHVLTQNNRELTVAAKRILHACSGPSPAPTSRRQILDLLEETARRRETLKAGILLEELWELLAEENQPLALPEMAELWFGSALPDQVAALGHLLLDDRLLFKYKEGLWVPNPPEVVEALREQQQREQAFQQELAEVAAWLRTVWEGGSYDPHPRQPRLVDLLRQMAVWGAQAPDYDRGKEYLERAGLAHEDAPFRLLVRLGVFHEDENLDLYRLEVPQDFSPTALQQARQLRDSGRPDPFEAHRLDLTGLQCFTIDGERTRDFDDALSLEEVPSGWRLGIHIADVAALVQPQTELDREAQERGTSIYLPEHRLPMFPEEISEATLSLLAGQERPALSFLVTLDPAGRVLDGAIHPSRIRVRQRLTYQEVERVLNQDGPLATLAGLTQRFKQQRLAQGGYELHLPEVWVAFDPQGEVLVTVEDQETRSRQLVAEAMVLANTLASRFLVEQNIPAIFRSQPDPREPIDREEPKGLLELCRDRRRLSRVVMDLSPQPHWGLGLECYTFATSPIRRYLDVVIHRQLLPVLSGMAPRYDREELARILMVIEPSMRRAGLLKNRRLRYWLLKYLARRQGQKMEALVLESLPHRYRMILPKILLEFLWSPPTGMRLHSGDNIHVRLDRVLPREDQIKVSLA